MNFLCFGVGAIGTYIGGSLAVSGQRVVFVEQPGVAAEICQKGLHIKVGAQENHLAKPEVVGSLAEAIQMGPFDAALLAVKSFDTPAVLAGVAPYRDLMPPVLSLQNGVENEATITEVLGPGKAISASVTTAVGRLAAGSVVVEKLRGVGVGIDHPLGSKLVAVMDAAGLKARAYPDSTSMKWSKMLTNLQANASSAILDMSPAEIFAHPGLFRMEIQMLKEALAVMAARSIRVTDLPGTPVRALIWGIKYLPPEVSQPLAVQFLGKGRGGKMPSFHIDLHSGRGRSEVDYLNGAVVRFGEKAGVSAPVNRWLNQTLLDLTAGKLPLETYSRQPEKLLQAISKMEISG